jgi:hypothetical protein
VRRVCSDVYMTLILIAESYCRRMQYRVIWEMGAKTAIGTVNVTKGLVLDIADSEALLSILEFGDPSLSVWKQPFWNVFRHLNDPKNQSPLFPKCPLSHLKPGEVQALDQMASTLSNLAPDTFAR